MSKMDNLRAMREARYAESQARTKQAGTTPRATKSAAAAEKPAARKAAAPQAAPAAEAPGAAEELCGHRNMSGRSCTREKGHAAKSHRYS
ncbi:MULTISPECIES: hypothetical protein [Nocardioides]|uniref:hypothetical protein n=1 Tax=Nocardioides TaxID=1839 RepID=UPI000CE45201|nr:MULTISPECIES: hypothetical protein [Nocardioides]